jgi:formylglycine-generating enzyme required for sulfatase activity
VTTTTVGKSWRLVAVLATLWLAVHTGCATGKTPPPDSPTAVVPAGTFLFGMGERSCGIPANALQCTEKSELSFDPGTPSRLVRLDAFEIDVHEVTNAQYRFCVDMGICSRPFGDNGPPQTNKDDYFINEKYDDFPVLYVTWAQAREYCAMRGKRLPTEYEWERTASGAGTTVETKFLYPPAVGDAGPDTKLPDKCALNLNIPACTGGAADTRPVMTSADDAVQVNGTTVFDLTGNVSEWTSNDGDEAAKKISATCDLKQPYDCSKCVECLRTGAKAKCELPPYSCSTCACGTTVVGKPRANCYTPCAAPVCPTFIDPVPADKTFSAKVDKNFGSFRAVRGSSYSSATGFGEACSSRFDYRGFVRKPELPPLPHVGFRCAKSH